MDTQQPTYDPYDDEIDLFELWETIWSGRWLIIGITALFGFGGVSYALLAPEIFKAQVTVMPSGARTAGGGLASALGGLGGLASLAGVSIGGGGSQEPLAVLKSGEFTTAFIEDNDLMPVLFPVEKRSSDRPVDIRDGVRRIDRGIRAVVEDKKTGLITITVTWKDPDTAARWANAMVSRLNEQMRTRALEESERNVAFLQREIAATNVVSLQQAMGRVLETEMQKLMLARGNEQFAFKVIDKATPPKYRDWPKRTLIVLISVLAGGFLGILVVFIRKAIRNRPQTKSAKEMRSA